MSVRLTSHRFSIRLNYRETHKKTLENFAPLGFRGSDLRLILNIFKMRIRDRYLGSALGIIWAILHPLFLLGTYTFVFGFVFKTKIPGSDTTLSYAIWMISGFVPYLAFTESVNDSANSVVSSAALVKNIVKSL